MKRAAPGCDTHTREQPVSYNLGAFCSLSFSLREHWNSRPAGNPERGVLLSWVSPFPGPLELDFEFAEAGDENLISSFKSFLHDFKSGVHEFCGPLLVMHV